MNLLIRYDKNVLSVDGLHAALSGFLGTVTTQHASYSDIQDLAVEEYDVVFNIVTSEHQLRAIETLPSVGKVSKTFIVPFTSVPYQNSDVISVFFDPNVMRFLMTQSILEAYFSLTK